MTYLSAKCSGKNSDAILFCLLGTVTKYFDINYWKMLLRLTLFRQYEIWIAGKSVKNFFFNFIGIIIFPLTKQNIPFRKYSWKFLSQCFLFVLFLVSLVLIFFLNLLSFLTLSIAFSISRHFLSLRVVFFGSLPWCIYRLPSISSFPIRTTKIKI